MVSAQDDRANRTLPNHLVEPESNRGTSFGVLIENTSFGSHDQLMSLGFFYPAVVVLILVPKNGTEFLNALGGGSIGLLKIFVFSAQADPTKRPVSIVKELGT